jgi:hypothetical protein
MATVEACRAALDHLAGLLADVDPQVRARHIPSRTITCRVTDLKMSFVGTLDHHGVHDLVETNGQSPDSDVRVSLTSDQLVALANGEEEFLNAWLRGRVQVSASMRDLLRLRSLFGM